MIDSVRALYDALQHEAELSEEVRGEDQTWEWPTILRRAADDIRLTESSSSVLRGAAYALWSVDYPRSSRSSLLRAVAEALDGFDEFEDYARNITAAPPFTWPDEIAAAPFTDMGSDNPACVVAIAALRAMSDAAATPAVGDGCDWGHCMREAARLARIALQLEEADPATPQPH
ncbi:hypothetical protein [Streptacidiphilus jiangxiensis]|uniref:Uncharacterized protein n=1 Tax=Streptacidiphilus jiangxiensis TaxID=235985 RepID=A0A1H7WJL4_STRJI|nr:hypothetical protein [Streptacidiphilus jiangxiensis]SEM21681.1 hypothetical protein SAMN05414137_120209 [Streptacidiphilus jiangxiensis]